MLRGFSPYLLSLVERRVFTKIDIPHRIDRHTPYSKAYGFSPFIITMFEEFIEYMSESRITTKHNK